MSLPTDRELRDACDAGEAVVVDNQGREVERVPWQRDESEAWNVVGWRSGDADA